MSVSFSEASKSGDSEDDARADAARVPNTKWAAKETIWLVECGMFRLLVYFFEVLL